MIFIKSESDGNSSLNLSVAPWVDVSSQEQHQTLSGGLALINRGASIKKKNPNKHVFNEQLRNKTPCVY